MDNYDSYDYSVNYGEEDTDGFGEDEDTIGGASSSTASVGGGSVSVGGGSASTVGGSVSIGGSSISVGSGSVSVSGSAGVGGGSASTGAGAGMEKAQIGVGEEADYTDLDAFKEESITDLTDSELDKAYSDYKDYYSEVDDKVLPAETDNYQVVLGTHTHQKLHQAQHAMMTVNHTKQQPCLP